MENKIEVNKYGPIYKLDNGNYLEIYKMDSVVICDKNGDNISFCRKGLLRKVMDAKDNISDVKEIIKEELDTCAKEEVSDGYIDIVAKYMTNDDFYVRREKNGPLVVYDTICKVSLTDDGRLKVTYSNGEEKISGENIFELMKKSSDKEYIIRTVYCNTLISSAVNNDNSIPYALIRTEIVNVVVLMLMQEYEVYMKGTKYEKEFDDSVVGDSDINSVTLNVNGNDITINGKGKITLTSDGDAIQLKVGDNVINVSPNGLKHDMSRVHSMEDVYSTVTSRVYNVLKPCGAKATKIFNDKIEPAIHDFVDGVSSSIMNDRVKEQGYEDEDDRDKDEDDEDEEDRPRRNKTNESPVTLMIAAVFIVFMILFVVSC